MQDPGSSGSIKAYIFPKLSFDTFLAVSLSFLIVYFQTSGTITHVGSGKCLDVANEKSGGHIVVKDCDKSDTQKWTFEHYLT